MRDGSPPNRPRHSTSTQVAINRMVTSIAPTHGLARRDSNPRPNVCNPDRIPIPQVSVIPAEIKPAPINPQRAYHAGATAAPKTIPKIIIVPAAKEKSWQQAQRIEELKTETRYARNVASQEEYEGVLAKAKERLARVETCP